MSVRLSFLCLLLLCAVSLHAQKFAAISADGRVLATYRTGGLAKGEHINKKGKTKNKVQVKVFVDVWNARFKKKVCSIAILGGKKSIHEVKLSPDGRTIFIGKRRGGMVLDTKSGKELAKTPGGAAVAFSHTSNVFVVVSKRGSAVYDRFSGKQLEKIRYNGRERARQFFFSPDDRYLVLIDYKDRLTVFERGKRKPIKKFNGRQAFFDQENETFTYYKYNGSNANVTTYQLPNFERLGKINCAKIIIKRAATNARRYKKGDLEDLTLTKLRPRSFDFVSPSPNGQFTALAAYRGDLGYYILVVNTKTGKQVFEDKASLEVDHHLKLSWENDSLLQIHKKQGYTKAINVANPDRDQAEYNYWMKQEKAGSSKHQLMKKTDSPKAIWRSVSDAKGLSMKEVKNDAEYHWPKVAWLGCDEQERYLYVTGSKGSVGFVRLDSLGHGYTDITWMASEAVVFEESASPFDDIAPAGYEYIPFGEIYPMDSMQRSKEIDLHLKGVDVGDSITSIHVQLFDEDGNHYSGASMEDWKKVWCNLILRSPDGTTNQITDFEIIEHQTTDSIPRAFAVVMDFSGSMGPQRANALQRGVREMVKQKRDFDAMAVIKYDNKIAVEANLTTNANKLTRVLNENNYFKFKGGTSMLDATNAGIGALQEADGFGSKTVILMTDGIEGGSFSTITDVIVNAKKQNVSIVTVGYGSRVDERFLKTMSMNTDGAFHRIYRGKDLNEIFDDIYDRNRTYYEIRIKTKAIGKYRAMIKTCLDVPSERLVVDFKVDGIDLDTVDVTNTDFFGIPVKEQPPEVVKDDKSFAQPDITDFSKLQVLKPGQVELRDTVIAEVALVEKEFEQLDFPHFEFEFDQTVIVAFEEQKLQKLVDYLNKYPEVQLDINGHTDSVGRHEYNLQLSEDRAEKVKELLVEKGITGERLSPFGFGSTDPLASNQTEKGRLRNRRVEFTISE